MTEHVASRTLVKSPPELWAECSDAASLARHLDGFGEIRITRLEPETAVAWEGERARGTVRIEPSGWGTKVILTAVAESEPEAVEEMEAVEVVDEAEPIEVVEAPEVIEAMDDTVEEPNPEEPAPATDPPPVRKRRFARFFGFFRAPVPEPDQPPEPAAFPGPEPPQPEPTELVEPPPEPEPEPEPESPDPAPDPDPDPDPRHRPRHRSRGRTARHRGRAHGSAGQPRPSASPPVLARLGAVARRASTERD